MPGWWEQRQRESVLAYTLHTDTVTVAWAMGIRRLQLPGQFIAVAGMPFDHARNSACMACLERGFDWLFSLDSDVIPPPDAVLRLMAHRQPIISGVYHRRSNPAGVPVMQRPLGQWVRQYPPNKVIEVDTVGAGCLLIHKSVLERLPPQRPQAGKHWFNWAVDCPPEHNPVAPMSEDYTFAQWSIKHGYKVLVDTSVQCLHVGYAQFGYGSAVPLETAAA